LFLTVALNVENKFLKLLNEDIFLIESNTVILELIKSSAEDFLVAAYGYNININQRILNRSLYVQFLLKDSDILIKLTLQSLYDENSEAFRSVFEPIYNKPSVRFLETLLDNLVVEVSNCVMQIIINEFSLIYSIRQNLYKSNFLSLRNIERFKNNLAWQIRLKLYVNYPNNLYNNQYGIWIIRSNGLYFRRIYANRSKKLLALQKASLLTVTLIEIQDFLSSRLAEVVYLLGDRIRYTLTSTVGQFIGLIWRGIIEGLKK
jgi:hypothetical protein